MKMINLFTETNQIFALVDGPATPLLGDRTNLAKGASPISWQRALPVCCDIRVIDLGFWYWSGILNVGPIRQFKSGRRREHVIAL